MSYAPPPRAESRPCEVERAFRELIGKPWPGLAAGAAGCSPEPPETRTFPSPLSPGQFYSLCNGHLRDLLDAIGRAKAHLAAPAP